MSGDPVDLHRVCDWSDALHGIAHGDTAALVAFIRKWGVSDAERETVAAVIESPPSRPRANQARVLKRDGIEALCVAFGHQRLMRGHASVTDAEVYAMVGRWLHMEPESVKREVMKYRIKRRLGVKR